MEVTIEEVHSLHWVNPEHTLMRAYVKFSHRQGSDPITISDNYDTELGQTLWDEAISGIHGEITPYEEPVPPTIEEIRASMQPLTPREFRDALIDNDIMPEQVTEKIMSIPFDKERAKALNAWDKASDFYRTDPYIDMIAAMFDITPEQIDDMWKEALLTRGIF